MLSDYVIHPFVYFSWIPNENEIQELLSISLLEYILQNLHRLVLSYNIIVKLIVLNCH